MTREADVTRVLSASNQPNKAAGGNLNDPGLSARSAAALES